MSDGDEATQEELGTVETANQILYELKQLEKRVMEKELPSFEDDLDDAVFDQVIHVAKVPRRALQQRTEEVAREKAERFDSRVAAHRRHLSNVQRARARGLASMQEFHAAYKKQQKTSHREELVELSFRGRKITEAFTDTFDEGQKLLKERRTHQKEQFGPHGLFTELARDTRKLSTEIPQIIQIQIEGVGGLRDRVPRGRYCIVVSKLKHVSGPVQRWYPSFRKDQAIRNGLASVWSSCFDPKTADGDEAPPDRARLFCGATAPFFHSGSHEEVLTLPLDWNLLYTSVQSVDYVTPTAVFLFELVLLRGHASPVDVTVGWGILPQINVSMHALEGRFRVPLLKGAVDPNVRLYKHLRKQLCSIDQDYWLANVYVTLTAYEADGSLVQATADRIGNMLETFLGVGTIETPRDLAILDSEYRNSPIPDDLSLSIDMQRIARISPDYDSEPELQIKPSDAYGFDEHALDFTPDTEAIIQDEPTEGDLLMAVAEDEVELERRRRDFPYNDFEVSLPQPTETSSRFSLAHKFRILKRVYYEDLGANKFFSTTFLMTFIIFCLLLPIRMYTRTFAQLMVHDYYETPLYTSDLYWVYADLSYEATLLPVYPEVAITFIGPFSMMVVFFLLGLMTGALQSLFDTAMPQVISNSVMMFGILSLLDPVIQLATDVVFQTSSIEAYKLASWFDSVESNLIFGLLLTLVSYLLHFTFSLLLLYYFLLFVHTGGRTGDAYGRLTDTRGYYFTPHDTEVTLRELRDVCRRAMRYRGFDKESQLHIVRDIQLEIDESTEKATLPTEESALLLETLTSGVDFSVPPRSVSTVTIRVDNVYFRKTLQGTRKLVRRQPYRRFLRQADGTINEVFLSYDFERWLPKRTEPTKDRDIIATVAGVPDYHKRPAPVPVRL